MANIIPRGKVHGTVTLLAKAAGKDFVSARCDELNMTYAGISGDFHEGVTRIAGSREPWYKSPTEIKNERQVSILASDELQHAANNLGVERIDPEWIGANIVIDGIKDLSLLPSRTVLMFEGGVSLRVDGYNGPCRVAGAEIARHIGVAEGEDPRNTDIALGFAKAAELKRGVVAWVEREGIIREGEKVTGIVQEQYLYEHHLK